MLRPYQQNAHDAAVSWVKKSIDHGLIEAETGSGKSHIIAHVSETFYKMSEKHVLCTAPSVDLIVQNREKFLATGNPSSIFSASIETSLRHPVVFGTPLSIKNQLKRFGSKFGLVCIDEAHGITPTIRHIIDDLRDKNDKLRVIGLSATPYRLGSGLIYGMDENDKPSREDECRNPYFAKRIFCIGGRELVEQGYLCAPVIGAINADGYKTKNIRVNASTGKFFQADIDQAYEGQGRKTSRIMADVVENTRNSAGVMIFAATVNHAKECLASLPPELSRMIGGDINTGKGRRKFIEDFKARKFKYNVSVATQTTGVDYPHVDTIVILRPSESVSLIRQILGRGARLNHRLDMPLDTVEQRLQAIYLSEKPHYTVYDYSGTLDRFFPDGDLFDPKIKAWNDKKSGGIVKAICPQCNTENEFSARKNEDGFAYDQNGYFVDLDGNRIESEYGPMPSHYGRRCFGLELRKGEHQRCNYRWTFKACGECNAENDIAARYCAECKAELIDPNEKLIADFKAHKRDPYAIQTDKVISWEIRKTLARSGAECLVVDYITEYRKVTIWYHIRSGHQFLIKQYEAFMRVTNGGEYQPETITYRKEQKENSSFYKILAYNQQSDESPKLRFGMQTCSASPLTR